MIETKWSASEKRIAHRAFEAALQRELAAVMVEFKKRAAGAKDTDDMWDTGEYLARTRRDIDFRYDYRYSQLIVVFGRLLREGFLDERELDGLADDKLAHIRRIASL